MLDLHRWKPESKPTEDATSARRLRWNFCANILGSGWSAIAQLLCVPLYLKLLGVEGYGLIGFYVTMRTALLVLDLGLATTVNRGLASMSVDPAQSQSMRDLARTLEIGYWILGVAMAVALMISAPYIAANWLQASRLPHGLVARALVFMGFLIGLQWPLSLYQGSLMGLQRQVQLNVFKAIDVTLSTVGAVLAMLFISHDVSVFFACQIVASVFHLVLIRRALLRALPRGERPARVDLRLLGSLRSFAVGMSGISIFGLILLQMDKVVLSRLLTVEAFAYYILADTLANGLYVLITPVFGAIYPRFTADAARRDITALRSLYHGGSQILAVLMAPLAALLMLCPVVVVGTWTGDVATARETGAILTLLAAGTALNGMMQIPYALQLAFGWTRIGLVIRAGQVLVFLPLLILMAERYGGLGASGVWLALNIVYVAVGVVWTHRKLLIGDAARWLVIDVGLPALAAFGVVWALKHLLSASDNRFQEMVQLGAMLMAALIASLAVVPRVRSVIGRVVRTRRIESVP